MSAVVPVHKTLAEFNQFITKIYQTVLPVGINNLHVREYTSFKYPIWDVIFGKGVFGTGQPPKELTLEEAFIFEDSPIGTSGTGQKAVGFRQAEFERALADVESLNTDDDFQADLAQLYANNPEYRNALKRAMDRIIGIFAKRKAQSMVLLAQEDAAELEQLALDLEGSYDPVYNLIIPPTPASRYERFRKWASDKVHGINKANINKAYKTVIQIKDEIEKVVGSSFSIVAWAGIYSGVRKMFGKIPLLLGPVPLKHVDYVEIARSGKILKFRATGSVFLAKQEGGADAIKIEGTMYKAEFIVMFLLWALFAYGQSKFRDMEDLPGLVPAQNVFEVRKLNDLIMTDTTLEKPSYEFHQTFPFVSKHFIIPNCFIETISIEDKLPLKDVLKYSILLRTYDKPKEVSHVEGKKGKVLYGIKNKTTLAKVCEYSLNATWRMLNANGWLINEDEWKIGSASNEGVLDTYYDVDWSTIASVAYLNLMGVTL